MRAMHWLAVVALVSCTKSGGAEEPRASALSMASTSPRGAAAGAAPVATAPATAPLAAPSEAAAAFQLSYDQEAAGKNDAALDALDALPAAQKEAYVTALRRGWLLYRLARNAESVTAYAKASALAPQAIESKVGVLAPLSALRRWADVEAGARDVLRRDPASYLATLRLAYALYSGGKLAEAEAAYRALLAMYPSDADVRAGLGWSLLKLGRASEAATAFAEVLEFAPKNTLATDGLRAAGGKR